MYLTHVTIYFETPLGPVITLSLSGHSVAHLTLNFETNRAKTVPVNCAADATEHPP